jgi:hypothetical protein
MLASACTPVVESAAPAATSGPHPTGPPVLGIDWARASSVERPANFVETVAPSYVSVHPILRIPGQATMQDVMALSGGGYVSVGYSPPTFEPVAWTSADGLTWAFHQIETTEFTFPESLAAGADGTVLAVGRSGRSPVAWTTRDGSAWKRHDVAIVGTDGTAERMTAVAFGEGRFVAGGSVGPELAERHARFWTSSDGVTWQPAPDNASVFANAEVRAITPFGDGFVAVGIVGDAQTQTDAVAWTSPDGMSWSRIHSPAFDGGKAVSIVAAPGGGLVAVGTTVERREAVAWTSADGREWTKAPTEPSRLYPGYAEGAGGYTQMTDVAVVGSELLGVGVFQGLQRGTGTSWVSKDGIHWTQAVAAPVQQQAEFYAVTAGGPGAIVVGSFGAPDAYVPQVWVSPGR